MMTQWSACIQNHLEVSTNLTLWSQQHNKRDLKFKIYCVHIKLFVKFFNWINYSDPNHTHKNSQYLTYNFNQSYDPHSGHGCSPEAREGTQASAQPSSIKQQLHWAHYLLKQWTICLVCWITASPYCHSYLSVLTLGQWQLADRNNCTTMPLNHNCQPRTSTL